MPSAQGPDCRLLMARVCTLNPQPTGQLPEYDRPIWEKIRLLVSGFLATLIQVPGYYRDLVNTSKYASEYRNLSSHRFSHSPKEQRVSGSSRKAHPLRLPEPRLPPAPEALVPFQLLVGLGPTEGTRGNREGGCSSGTAPCTKSRCISAMENLATVFRCPN